MGTKIQNHLLWMWCTFKFNPHPIVQMLASCFILRDTETESHVIIVRTPPPLSPAQLCSGDFAGDCGPPVHLQ